MVAERILDEPDIAFVRHLISSHPTWSRWRLSRQLAEAWNTRTATDQLKDMSVRHLLGKMHKRHLIVLPPLRRSPPKRQRPLPELFDTPPAPPLEQPLADLLPLQVEGVARKHRSYGTFAHYLARYHYLGYHRPAGENIGYLVRDCQGRDLACLLFSGAAWKTKPRDVFLGWDAATRIRRLSYLTNNTRFLILSWVRVPHLASHVLGLITRRLASDWQAKYGHPVYAVETFVERDRFRGTCYRAANWICLGQTQGRSRADRYNTLRVPIKDIYLYPLTPRFKEKLCHADS